LLFGPRRIARAAISGDKPMITPEAGMCARLAFGSAAAQKIPLEAGRPFSFMLASGESLHWLGQTHRWGCAQIPGDYGMSKLSTLLAASAAFLAAAAAASPAMAQTRPNPGADPTYGTANLRSGFQPDPHRVSVQSGGSIDADVLGGQCDGFVARAPDYDMNWTAGSGALPLIIGVTASADTTLVINGPDGRWYCDDDSGDGSNPLIRFNNPQGGLYDIWVGTYESRANFNSQLYITELSSNVPGPSGGRPDLSATPTYGTVRLRSGFEPDPHDVSVQSGGSINAEVLGSACKGFVASAPDVNLSWNSANEKNSGSRTGLPLIISVDSNVDTTLVVNAPDGSWFCNDDSGNGSNPSLRFDRPQSGLYNIWVGTYENTGNYRSTLSVSELQSR
jgi:hypothetical protein